LTVERNWSCMRNDSVFGRRVVVCVGVQSEAIGMLSVRIRQRRYGAGEDDTCQEGMRPLLTKTGFHVLFEFVLVVRKEKSSRMLVYSIMKIQSN